MINAIEVINNDNYREATLEPMAYIMYVMGSNVK